MGRRSEQHRHDGPGGHPIGRARECAAIAEFLDDLHDGVGGVLLLEGDAGSGKTTLASWALDEARRRDMTALTARSWERAQAVPYEPIVAAIGRLLRMSRPEARAELTAGLQSLAALFDGLDLDPLPAHADGNRARLHDALATLLSRQAAKAPVLFHLDDVHWTDPSSLEVVQFICRDLPWVRLGILATLRPADADARPDVRNMIASLRRADVSCSIAVRSLDRDETIAVLRDRLPGAIPARLEEMVWSRSAGTPLVMHEMVEDLLGRRLLVETDRGWDLLEHDPALPRAVSDLITDRIDQLGAVERQVLEVLAVADEPTTLDVLTAVTGQPEAEVSRALADLRQRRLVTSLSDGPTGDLQWHPDHPIIGEVAADHLDELVRKRVHRRLFEADPDAGLARRARHIVHGGDPADLDTAIDVLLSAADEAWTRGAPGEAVAFAEHAETLVARHEVAATPWRARIDFRIGASLSRLHHNDAAIDRLGRAFDALLTDGELETLIETFRQLDRTHFHRGDPAAAVMRPRYAQLRDRVIGVGTPDDLARIEWLHMQSAVRDDPDNADALDPGGSSAEPDDDNATPLASAFRRITSTWADYMRGSDRPLADAIDELLDISRWDLDWEHRHRAALTALDCAGALGEKHLIEQVTSRLREIDREIGEPANWREAMLRAWTDVHRDGDTEAIDALRGSGRMSRVTQLVALVESVVQRWVDGPEAALAAYAARIGQLDHGWDGVAVWNDRLTRLWLARGSPAEGEAATAILQSLDNRATPLRLSANQAGVFDPAWILAIAHGDAAEFQAMRRVLANRAQGVGWLHAGMLHADTRRPEHADRRAQLSVDAAATSRENDLDLLAAEHFLDAAEHDRTSVSTDDIAWARATADRAGARWLSERADAVGAAAGERPDDSLLTRREWEVATEVSKGLTNREVAGELFISIRTVTSHLDHIYTKLGFSSREELTDYVRTHTGT